MLRVSKRTVILAGTVALLLLSSLLVWVVLNRGHEEYEYLHSMPKDTVFDFNNPRSETKTLYLDLFVDGSKVQDATEVLVSASRRYDLLVRYPDTANGEVRCWFEMIVNGENVFERSYASYHVQGSGPEQWGRPRDEATRSSAADTFPSPDDRDILDLLNPDSMNTVRAIASCTSHITSTGPALVIFSLGPVHALIG